MTTKYRLYFHRTTVDVLDIDADSVQLALDHGWMLFDSGEAPFNTEIPDITAVDVTCESLMTESEE